MARAGFEVIGDKDDGQLQKLPTSAITAAIGDLLERLAGSTTWAAITSTSNYFSPKAIVEETATSSDSVLCYRLTGDEKVRAETANNTVVAHYGDRMLATDTNTVNNTGTDNTSQNVIFLQEGVAGALADKRAVGRVLVGNGVDPDAA